MERKNFKFTKKTLIITLYAAVFVILAASYGISAMLLGPPPEEIPPDIKNGIIRDEDGEVRLYKNGRATYGGLIQDSAGNYYYISSSLIAVRNCSYTISKTNGLLPEGTYNFDRDGKMIGSPSPQPEQ